MKLARLSNALTDRQLVTALIAEFIGSAIFQLFAGALPVETVNDQPNYTDRDTAATIALANGAIYTSLVYLTRHISGGHLNPAVTIAVTASGHLNVIKGVLYVTVQVAGGICGALLAHFSMSGGSYCFDKDSTDTGNDLWELFAWEILMTWVFIMVVYSATLQPGHGDMGPLVIGIALTGCIWAGVAHSGGVMNPLRIISPSVANINSDRQCQADVFWYYIMAEAGAAALAALSCLMLHGPGPNYRTSFARDANLQDLLERGEHS